MTGLLATRVRFAVACAFLTSQAAAQRAWTTPGEEELDGARRLSVEGRCGDALALFDRAAEVRSEDASVRRDRGLCHEKLGHDAPAIDDYRAYLAGDPTAPDAGPIRTRLEALEARRPPERPTPAPPPNAPSTRDAAPTDATEPEEPRSGSAGQGSWLLGPHVGGRAWPDKGYAKPTISYGLALGYGVTDELEADLRLVYLQTNIRSTDGFGASAGMSLKIGLDTESRWAIGIGAGVGCEVQEDLFRISRTHLFARLSPALRFNVVPRVLLALGPEVGAGSMTSSGVVGLDAGGSDLVLHYGAQVTLAWMIWQRSGEASP